MRVALYARVSTKDKDQNPENQLIRLREYSRKRGWEYTEYTDYASGSKADREGLQMMINELDELDGILVLRLDRFGRSLRNLLDLLDKIRKQGKFFEAIDQGLRLSDKKDPMSDFMLSILGAAAEFERELISERVRDGMARAKRQGKLIGRGPSEKTKRMERRILELRSQGEPIRMISQKTNIPRSTVSSILSRQTHLNWDRKTVPGILKEKEGEANVPFSDGEK
jgi:DNA invertase Pin-like site-specific DNA recombinase